jgi:hypothetical protein
MKSRIHVSTHWVSGGFQVTHGFEQSEGEFDHEIVAD